MIASLLNAGAERAPAAQPLTGRDKIWLVVSLVSICAVAWLYMLYDYWQMQTLPMSQMWMPPTGGASWSLSDFWLTFVMWSVMMAAMMVPSATPMVTMFATINRNKRARQQPHVSTLVFISGYVIAWTAFSAVVTLVQWPMHHFALLTPMMDNNSHVLAGVVLIIAGVYQWTPWKDACLSYCRTPLAFVMTEWRDGAKGALHMGTKHGLYCVGCCWAMMLVLFAVGVMNMLWVVLITLFVIFEKVMPAGPWMTRLISGILLVGWGISFLLF